MTVQSQPARSHKDSGSALPAPGTASPGDDATIAAAGKLSEALEIVEHARGLLYGFHRLSGSADLTLQKAVRALREAGHHQLADQLDRDLVGRNVVGGMWSFELVEAYDAQYWQAFRAAERDARQQLGTGKHQYEAQMKGQEQSPDLDGQETQRARPL